MTEPRPDTTPEQIRQIRDALVQAANACHWPDEISDDNTQGMMIRASRMLESFATLKERVREIENWAAKVCRAHTYASENAESYRQYDHGYSRAQQTVARLLSCPMDAFQPKQARSKSEFKRLKALGVNVAPPSEPTV